MSELLNTEQAATELGLSQSRVRAMLRAGELTGEREPNGPWRIDGESVSAELARRGGRSGRVGSDLTASGNPQTDSKPLPDEEDSSDGEESGSGIQGSQPLLERITPEPIRRRLRRSRLDREALRWHHGERDDQENRDSEPPADETILLRSYWTAEVYTPATVQNLVAALDRLGRSRTGSRLDEPGQWVAGVRSRPSAGAWSTLGRGHRATREGTPFGRALHLDLPDSVKEVDLSLFSAGPATTVLLAGFLFETDASRSLDDALRAKYKTYIEPSKENRNWRSYHMPANQKQAAVASVVATLRADCSEVLRATFPGSLCVDDDSPHPGIFVMTTEKSVPLADEGRWSSRDYRMIARIRESWPCWQAEDPGSWRFDSDWLRWEKVNGLALIAARRNDVADAEKLKMYGGGEHALDYSLTDYMRGLVCRWVLLDYLRRLHTRLGAQRDQLARDTRSPGSIKHLERLRRELVDTTLDARASAEDIRLLAEHEHVYGYDVWDFAGSYPGANEEPSEEEMSLVESLRSQTEWQAQRVEASQQAVFDLLTADADLRGSISNLRLQRTLRWLALLALLIALLNVAVVVLDVGSETSSDEPVGQPADQTY